MHSNIANGSRIEEKKRGDTGWRDTVIEGYRLWILICFNILYEVKKLLRILKILDTMKLYTVNISWELLLIENQF